MTVFLCGSFCSSNCLRFFSGVELDSSQYVTPFNENGIRTQTKLNSTEAVATVSPFRTSRASNRTSSLTGPICDAETQRLRRELQQEQERVQRLSAQLSTNVRSLILLIKAFTFSHHTLFARIKMLCMLKTLVTL